MITKTSPALSPPSPPHTIGLLFTNPADRKLLLEFVEQAGFQALAPEVAEARLDGWQDVSLIIADQSAAYRYKGELLALKKRSEAVFLPLLVALPRQTEGIAWLQAGFDDLLRLPLTKAELGARLATFLRLRAQSVELAERGRAMYRALVEQSLVGVYLIAGDRFVYVNQALARIFGYKPDEIIDRLGPLDLTHPDDHALVQENVRKRLAGEVEGVHYTFQGLGRDGLPIHCEVFGRRIDYQGRPAILGTLVDITAGKQLEAEKEKLAAQFYQAQKMDSIGKLAGGIAHDFNNLLVPIIGYAELGMMQLPPENKLHTNFSRIKEAADRAANLTRQILAFGRQQVMEMRAHDLNLVIARFQEMLRRLIGEDIVLQTHLAAELQPVMADKGQLEQVLLNLAVNARDAMPTGGNLTIETANVVLDEAYVAQHPGAEPGPHVMLAVSDTGQGMDAATQERIFEPFFTTKAREQGTGLGLATVFGIVKQHGGNIWVYSEPGHGATFKIYLPVAGAPASGEETKPSEPGALSGTETVLVVEDETSARQLVCETLRAHGYRVLEAAGPEEGLKLAGAHRGTIHLLLTDIIMPTMNGRELYEQLGRARAGLKVLYMSGYTDNVIAHHGVLVEGVILLQKPFTLRNLLQTVRGVLG